MGYGLGRSNGFWADLVVDLQNGLEPETRPEELRGQKSTRRLQSSEGASGNAITRGRKRVNGKVGTKQTREISRG